MLEVEVKLKVDNSSVLAKLSEQKFEKGTTEYEKDVYFNSDKFELKAQDKALRIREHRNLETGEHDFVMNYKGPKLDNISMTREETEFVVPDYETGESLLNGLGFFAAGTVEKVRTHYTRGKTTCCLDKVTCLGEFLEVEIMAEDKDYDNAIREIEDLLEALGLKMSDSIRNSYLSMVMKQTDLK